MDKLNFKYKVIKNFLTKEEQKLLLDYTRIAHRNNFDSFDGTQSNNLDTKVYGDPVMESLLLQKMEIVSKQTGYELLPTYAFWRMYTYNSELTKHIDRPSCEISTTIMIGSCGKEWPIYMDGNKITLEDGDGVIYKGIELQHWRENFEGDWHSQVFLHYVDKNGPYKEWVKDKRMYWGTKE
jgi:hypothetical protein